MTRPEAKYEQGNKVEVGPTPRWSCDKAHIGKTGVIAREPWYNKMYSNASGHCYTVEFDDGAEANFFEEDLMSAEGDDYEIAKLEAQIEKIKAKKSRENKVNLPANLPVASSIFFPPNQLVIKVASDKWHWYHVDTKGMQFHSTSADKAVSGEIVTYLDTDQTYEVHRPTDL